MKLSLVVAPRQLIVVESLRGQATSADSAEKPFGKTAGTEPDPPEVAEIGLFSTMEGRPPCRPRFFSAESNAEVGAKNIMLNCLAFDFLGHGPFVERTITDGLGSALKR
jgi:hypothetical protein